MTATLERRRSARDPERVAVVISVAMLALLGWTVTTAGRDPAAAATGNGAASIVGPRGGPIARGGSATPFTLELGADPACPGDSAGADYRVQSFMVPSSVEVESLTFGANGPLAVDGQFRQPLFDTTSSPYVNELTDLAVPPAVTGGISGLPTFDFRVFAPGDVPAGGYTIGIACTLGPAGPSQLESFWSTTIAVTVSPDDRPAGITWRTPTAGGRAPSGSGGPPTTAGPPAEPRGGPTTTTTVDSTTTTEVSTATTAAFTGSNPSEPSVADTVGQLPLTGSSPWYRVAWAVFLLVFGRMAYLLGRRPKVRPPTSE